MKLTLLELEQFKKFSGKVRIDGFSDGLNLICAPNEFGKSTLLAAIRGLMFERHSSKAEKVRRMQTWHSQAAPRLAMNFTVAGGTWRIEKRFLHQPWARLSGPSGQVFESDPAEDELQRLLGFGAPGQKGSTEAQMGVWGALWVEQRGSVEQADLSKGLARATIASCLESEIGVLTGSERGQAVLASVREQLGRLIDGNKKPKGRYKEVLASIETLDKTRADLAARAQHLDEDVEALRDRERRLKLRLNPADIAADEAKLAEARQKREAALQVDQQIAAAQAQLELATKVFDEAAHEADTRNTRAQEIAALAAQLTHADDLTAPLERALSQASDDLAQRRAAVDLAHAQTEAAASDARRARAIADLAQRIATQQRLATSLAAAERAEAHMVQLSAALEIHKINPDLITRIRTADRDLATAQAALDASATLIDLELEPGAAGLVSLNGAPCPAGRQTITAAEPASIAISGIGLIRVRPVIKDGAKLLTRRATSERKLADLLADAGTGSVTSAERLAAERASLEADLREAQRQVEQLTQGDAASGLEPGLAALRARDQILRLAAATLRADLGLESVPPLAEAEILVRAAEAADDTARAHLTQARADQDAAQRAETDARAALERAASAAANAGAKHAQLRAAQDDALARETTGALAHRLHEARETLARRQARLAALEQSRAPDSVAAMDSRIERYAQALKNRDTEISQLRAEMAGLRARITQEGGAGLDELIAATERTRDALDLEAQNATREAAILTLLRDTLETAEAETKAQYLAPVTGRVTPYLAALFPGADIKIDDDMRISSIARNGGASEEFNRLSDGTREQIAVLARLAFAELLLDQGKPAMVILDDALAYADDDRMELMFDILNHAAKRMQILVLTCRESLFARLGGHRLEVKKNVLF